MRTHVVDRHGEPSYLHNLGVVTMIVVPLDFSQSMAIFSGRLREFSTSKCLKVEPNHASDTLTAVADFF